MAGFGYELLVIVLMLAVNGVFASYEMALASVSRARLLTLCQQGKRGATEAAYMKDRMEASLAVVQLGITLAGAIAAATGGAGAQESLTPLLASMGIEGFAAEAVSLACLVIPLSAFTIIFAELVPKMIALDNREAVCLGLSPAMKAIAYLAHPAVAFFEGTVKRVMRLGRKKGPPGATDPHELESLHELKAAAALARTSRLIGAHEEKIVLSAAQLSHRKVTDIMWGLSDIAMLPANDTLTEALIKVHLDMHTRFPVYEKEGDPQSIIGYLNFKDIVNAIKLNPQNPSVRGITRPIKKLPSDTTLSEALSGMMREKAHIALVISKQWEVLGMLTLEDIIEDLVGEIEDEFDRLPTHVHPCGTGWIVGGGVPMTTIATTMGLPVPPNGSSGKPPVLAEWLHQRLGREVAGGEILDLEGITLTVRKLRRKRLAEAHLIPTSKA